jgi:hypothetical protein
MSGMAMESALHEKAAPSTSDSSSRPPRPASSNSSTNSPTPPYLRRGIILTAAIWALHIALIYQYKSDFTSLGAYASVLTSVGSISAFIWLAIAAWYQGRILSDQARAIRAQIETVTIQTRTLELEEKHKDLNYAAALLPFVYSRLDRLAREIARFLTIPPDNPALSTNYYAFSAAATVADLMNADEFKEALHEQFSTNALIQRTALGYITLYESIKATLLTRHGDTPEKTILIDCMLSNTAYDDLYSDLSRLRRLVENSQPFI